MKRKMRTTQRILAMFLVLSLLASIPPITVRADESNSTDTGESGYVEDWGELKSGEKEQDGWIYIEENGEIHVKGFISKTGTVKVPEIIDGKPVTCLKKMKISKAVKILYLPKTIKKIELAWRSVNYKSKLREIVVDKANPRYMSQDGVVYSKDKKTLVWHPYNLRRVSILKGVERIGEGAFAGVSMETLKIPSTVKRIDTDAFRGCTSLKSVTMLNKVKKIGVRAFYDCVALESITLSNTLKRIEWKAFQGCISLKSITLPDTVEWIDASAFRRCKSLKSIVIPEKVTRVVDKTFKKCTGLRNVVVLGNITYIDKDAFESIGDTKRITFTARKDSYAYQWAKKKGFKVKEL